MTRPTPMAVSNGVPLQCDPARSATARADDTRHAPVPARVELGPILQRTDIVDTDRLCEQISTDRAARGGGGAHGLSAGTSCRRRA